MDRTSPSDADLLPLRKAGILIHGRLKKTVYDEADRKKLIPDEHVLIAPYTQGRFHDEQALKLIGDYGGPVVQDRMKYYALPKGGIDEGETVLEAAMRETFEETGIDIKLLLCRTLDEVKLYKSDSKHYVPPEVQRLAAGESITDLTSMGYQGVVIRQLDPMPYEHIYMSRASKPTRTAMYNLQVDGIEHLKRYLKNPENRDHERAGRPKVGMVETTVDEMINDANAKAQGHAAPYLTFDTYLQWLRNGAIPPDGFTMPGAARDNKHKYLYQHLDASPDKAFTVEGPSQPTWFSQLEQRYAPHGVIGSRSDWQKFWQRVEKNAPSDCAALSDCFKTIKKYAKGRGIADSDHENIKIDDKDSPLHYYQEGADLVSFERFIGQSLALAEVNSDYRRAFSGDCFALRDCSRIEQVQESQLAGVAAFANLRDIKRGIGRLHRSVSSIIPEHAHDAYYDEKFQLEEPLVRARFEQRQRHDTWVTQLAAGDTSVLSRLSP